jgi:hypothetical protein
MGPDFLYIGCPKAGSRWLYDQLRAHEAFWMPPIKEIHYLDRYEAGRDIAGKAPLFEARQRRKKGLPTGKDHRLERSAAAFIDQVRRDGGPRDLDWYASLFRWKGDLLSGDITPAYATLSPRMIDLVTARFPDLRLILFIRDPVARAWSQVCGDLLRRGGIVPKEWPELVSFLTSERVAAGSYPSRIFARWRQQVPAERIFVGFFDQLVAAPDVLRADLLRFLGAGSSPPAIEVGFDRKREVLRAPCPPQIQQRLVDWFSDELEACARVFGGPAIHWPVRYSLASAT